MGRSNRLLGDGDTDYLEANPGADSLAGGDGPDDQCHGGPDDDGYIGGSRHGCEVISGIP